MERVFVFHDRWSITKTCFWFDCDFKTRDLEILPNAEKWKNPDLKSLSCILAQKRWTSQIVQFERWTWKQRYTAQLAKLLPLMLGDVKQVDLVKWISSRKSNLGYIPWFSSMFQITWEGHTQSRRHTEFSFDVYFMLFILVIISITSPKL